MTFVLVVGFGWVYLVKKLLRLLEAKLQPNPLAQYASQQAQQERERMIFKLLIIAGSFLIVGIIVSFFLRSYPTFLVVSWVILIIFCSNILNQELRVYYRIGLEQVLSTIQMATVKVTHRKRPHITEQTPDLRSFVDTTAYLQALRQSFKPGETKRDDLHK